MAFEMSLDDFDQEVKMILDQEFLSVLEMGLVSEETLFPVVTGMRSSLRQAFPTMSRMEVEMYLLQLRQECRDTADSILALADITHWH